MPPVEPHCEAHPNFVVRRSWMALADSGDGELARHSRQCRRLCQALVGRPLAQKVMVASAGGLPCILDHNQSMRHGPMIGHGQHLEPQSLAPKSVPPH